MTHQLPSPSSESEPVDSLPERVAALAPAAYGAEAPEAKLSTRQRQAIEMIVLGIPQREVARRIGVDRSTIWRWRQADPNFIASLNLWRKRILEEMRDRTLSLCEKATDAVQVSIDNGDARIGLTIMDRMGVLTPGPVDPIDPHSVFGDGLEDEIIRGEVARQFQRLTQLMSDDQRPRSAALLALGMVIDDRAQGRATLPEVVEIAGPLPAGGGGSAYSAATAHGPPHKATHGPSYEAAHGPAHEDAHRPGSERPAVVSVATKGAGGCVTIRVTAHAGRRVWRR